MIAAIRWRLPLYGGLLLVPLLIGSQVYQGIEHLNHEIDTTSDLTSGGIDSLRLEVEYYRMRDGFERFVGGDPEIDFDELMTRFDIVWSRVVGVSQAPDFYQFTEEVGIQGLASDLFRVLQGIEPKVELLDRGHHAGLSEIRAALIDFEQGLASSSIGLSLKRQERSVEVRNNLASLVHNIGNLGIIIAIVVGGVVLAFTIEATHARRAEFDVRRREERTRFLAHHDALTSLANRSLLSERLKAALIDRRASADPFHLFALDLDGFKAVNDTYGHQVGDELLKIIGERLVNVVKATDLVARLGGDEFAIILHSCDSHQSVAEIARRVIATIEKPVIVGNNAIHVSASIGIANASDDGDTAEALLRCADVALYEAKASGRRTFRFFETEMDETLRHRLLLETGLRRAIETTKLKVHFQPQVDLGSGRVFGVEALVRWTDPELGPVPPDVFIEIASQCGMIFDLGEWVLETACRCATSWAEKGITPQIAINLSPMQLYHRDFMTMLDNTLLKTGLPNQRLTLEITEDAMVSDNDVTVGTLMSLRDRNITLAIDDFGTGYSNLGYLKRLPIQYLKIDRTFVKDIETDPGDRAIIQGIINLANSLGLKTIAEGVETEEQRHFLLASDCQMAQGFLYAPALPELEILPFLANAAEPLQRCHQPGLAHHLELPQASNYS